MTDLHSAPSGCPVVDFTYNPAAVPALTHFGRMDGHQDMARPVARTEEGVGYWIFTDQQAILAGLQQWDLWSSSVISPAQPDPVYRWIPVMLDPPEHSRWRRALSEYFSPGRVRAMLADQHALAVSLIEEIKGRGECEFVADFAQVFPSTIFLQIMGMPREKLSDFLQWEHMILHQDDSTDPDFSVRTGGMRQVHNYFAELVAERRANPDPQSQDIVSAAVNWEIDGAPATDTDILNCLLLLFMAGLDTVASQSAYAMMHLATHPEDRRRIAENPASVQRAVEELLRAYPIVQTARKATRDGDFHGCPVKAGDMALFPLAAAGRDELAYSHARSVDVERDVIRHISFGAGPHRCLGSHLARQEMAVLLTEWHRLIPDYEMIGKPTEHAGGVWSLDSLRLRWAT